MVQVQSQDKCGLISPEQKLDNCTVAEILTKSSLVTEMIFVCEVCLACNAGPRNMLLATGLELYALMPNGADLYASGIVPKEEPHGPP